MRSRTSSVSTASASRRLTAAAGRRSAARRAAFALAGAAVLAAATAPAASAQSTTPNSAILRMTGQLNIVFDKKFVTTLKRSKAKISVKSGATYSGKTRAATLPIDGSTAITFSPMTADVEAEGTIMMRRSTGQKVTIQDTTVRLRSGGADLGASLRGRHSKQLALFTVGPTTSVQQLPDGYQLIDVVLLVSPNLASAAKKAKIKNVRAGGIIGTLTAEIKAELPTFELPSFPGLIPGMPDPSLPPELLPPIT